MLLLTALVASLALAQDEILSNKRYHRNTCAGVYAPRKGDTLEPHVSLEFPEAENRGNAEVSYVIFNFRDINTVGKPVSGTHASVKYYVCDSKALSMKLCIPEEKGKIIINRYQPEPHNLVMTGKVTLPHDPVTYKVNETGYYCVATFPFEDKELQYKVNVHFMNSFGHLPASQVSLLWFHPVMAGLYFVFACYWIYTLFVNRRDILPVQKYLTALVLFMFAEQMIVWGYYFNFNKQGPHAASAKPYLVIIVLLGAARLSLTMFLLLIVTMGYSVVFPNLGKRMRYCQALGVSLFVTNTLYLLDSYRLVNSDEIDTFSFIALVLVFTVMAGFYFATLTSIGKTMQFLVQRKQHVKAHMYKMLWYILLGSMIAIFGFFVAHTLVFSMTRLQDVMNSYWKSKWVLSDGWPNFVYYLAFVAIAVIWRPTSNNKRYAMSSQLAQDESEVQEFEIGSLNGSDEEAEQARTPSPIDQEHQGQAQAQRASEDHSGAQRAEHSDHSDHHGLSELESDDGSGGESWNRVEDRDALVSAPGGRV